MLSVVSHIEIFAPQGAALPDLERTMREARANPDVLGAAPFVAAQALLARGEDMKGTLVRGIDPAREDRKSTRLNSSHLVISYAVFCLKKNKNQPHRTVAPANT